MFLQTHEEKDEGRGQPGAESLWLDARARRGSSGTRDASNNPHCFKVLSVILDFC